MIIYLYQKTHRKTGLKYLGMTSKPDPYNYKGSGVKWKLHIKKHGYDVETIILKECQSMSEIEEWGLYYSNLWNVVESTEWANLKEEAGHSGKHSIETIKKLSIANSGKVRTAEYKQHMSSVKKGQRYGPQTAEHKENNAAVKRGKPQPADAIAQRTKSRENYKWYNNGQRSFLSSSCPEECVPGRLPFNLKKLKL